VRRTIREHGDADVVNLAGRADFSEPTVLDRLRALPPPIKGAASCVATEPEPARGFARIFRRALA
jgi:hypothetical protein